MDLNTLNFVARIGSWVLFVLVCGWAFWRGGPYERIVAGLHVLCWGAWLVVQRFGGPEPGFEELCIDVFALCALIWLSIRSRRIWVFFITAATVNSVAAQVMNGWLNLGTYGLLAALAVWSTYAPLIGLAFGVWGYQREKKRATAASAPVL